MISVAVIIPFYQKKTGILRRALDSVLQQRVTPDVRVDIIIVDDGSPVPARTEVEGLAFAPPFNLTIKEQPNGGVAAARNTGLRQTNENTTYIAFLDSDDTWKPEHLTTAIAALDLGYDFYFCDSRRDGSAQSFFPEKSFDVFLNGPHAHLVGGKLYEIDQNIFFSESLLKHAYHICATVYRRSAAPDLLFESSLYVAGEDNLFSWLLISKSRRICCSTQELVLLMDGINIYASRFSWEDPGHLILHMGFIVALYKFREKLPLKKEEDLDFYRRIKMIRKIFAFLTIRYFLKKRELWPKELMELVHTDPKFWFWYPLNVLYVSVCFPLHLFDPLMEW
jgi:succinoglycan biosynthesis protein ExoW